MALVTINSEEWGELFHERAELLKIYCGLKRVMDFKTGIAGLTYRVNDSFFSELLYVESINGRSAISYGRGSVRGMIERLEKIGLIRRRYELGKNVFELVFALSGQSVQKSSSQGLAKGVAKVQPEVQPEKHPANVVVMRVSEKATANNSPEVEPTTTARSSPPLTSRYKDIDIYTRMADLHDYLKAFINERSLLSTHNRKLMNGWISQELTRLELQDAVGRAMQSTQGEGFGVSYLDKVVKQIFYQRTAGGKNETGSTGGEQPGEHGEAGDYLRRQSQLAAEYLEGGDN